MWHSLDHDGVEEKKMKISIDYDDTYTRDPVLWDKFAADALARGHQVYCVSARGESEMGDPKRTIGQVVGPDNCFGTGLLPKRDFMWRKHGIYIDVWIDDQPEMIVDREIEGLWIP
jgi:hypothetical protein